MAFWEGAARVQERKLPFAGLKRREWERLGDAAGLLTLALVVGFSSVGVYLHYGQDFRAFYAAGRVALGGGDPYDYRQITDVLVELTGFAGNAPFYHPPWFCFILAPLALLPWNVARGVWLALSWGLFLLGLTLLMSALEWRVRGWRRWLVWLSAFFMFGWVCLRFEQIGILLFAYLAWALWASKHNRNVQAGLAMALVLSKPNVTLLGFACLALALRHTRRRAVIWALAWLAVLTVVGTALFPGWLAHLTRPDFGLGLTWLTDGPDRVVERRLHSTWLHWLEAMGVGGPVAWGLFGGMALACIWWVVSLLRARSDTVFATSVGLTCTLLLTPYALLYDYAVLVVGLLWAYRQLTQSVATARRWGAVAVLVFMHSVLFWVGPEYDGYWLALGMAALLLVLGTSKGWSGTDPSLYDAPA
jgi:hypothetical protein